MNLFLPCLVVTLLICNVNAVGKDVIWDTWGTWTTWTTDEVEDSPWCDGHENCGGIIFERLVEDHECCPCICKEEGWCRVCVWPPTAICECICADPNVTDPEPADDTPPPLSSDQVTEALQDLKEKAANISDEIKTNRNAIAQCFPGEDILGLLNPVRNNAKKAGEEAANACEILAANSTLDNPALLRSLDAIADRLERAKKHLEEFMRAIGEIIAAEVGIDTMDPFWDWDNPDNTATILAAWNPDPVADPFCFVTKQLLLKWHPRFWSWGTWGSFTFNMWAQLCWCWFCVIYIRVVIIVKVWWSWIWTPWAWLQWPFQWCWWWSLLPFLGGGANN